MGNQDFPAAAPKEFPEYAFSISVILSVQESRDNRRPAQHTIPFCGIEVVFYPGEKKGAAPTNRGRDPLAAVLCEMMARCKNKTRRREYFY
jgi:hypothetical protein